MYIAYKKVLYKEVKKKYTVFRLGQTTGNYKQRDRTPKEDDEVRNVRRHDSGMINSSPCSLLMSSYLLYPE